MSERITLVNPYVIYECPDCGARVATDSPDSVPDCPDCGLLGVALEFVGLGEFISAESKAEIEHLRRALEGFRLMAEILRGLEWSGWDERFRAHMCPVCGGYKSKNKHFPDCDLNKALSFLRDVGRECADDE